MKKIYLGAIGLVSVVFLFVWCNDSGIEKADGVAEDFLNSFIEKATNVGGGGSGGGGNNTPICGNWSVTTPASCTDFGVETRTCTLGGSSYNETRNTQKQTTGCNTGGGGNVYTITFNANNGTASQTATTGTDGKLPSMPTTPTKSGYTFDGWCTSGGTQITTDYTFSANTTIYALWTAVSIVYGEPLIYGGQTYKTVKIGSQTWMAENLNYQTSSGSFQCMESGHDFCEWYGRLYTWAAAKTACPTGWKLPSSQEWQTLVDFAGGDSSAGKMLKAKSGWDYSGNGTDNFGFSALPGRYRNANGVLQNPGSVMGYWWTATEDGTFNNAYYRYMYFDHDRVEEWSNHSNSYGHSVRCIKSD
jgi:uncharacterized protein (TIGR02145 family)/uncharacterized repeat protein (TIGR02543 family)